MREALSPARREERFQRLLDVIHGPVSRRWSLAETTRYLQRLDLSGGAAEAYLLPLAAPLAELASGLDPVGLRPEQVWRPARLLRVAQEERPVLEDAGALTEAKRALRRRAALLLCYAGAPEKAAECLAPGEDNAALRDVPPAPPRQRVEAVRDAATARAVRQGLSWVLRHWEGETRSAAAPVVERLPAWARSGEALREPPEGRPQVGGLRRARVEIFGSAGEKDELAAPGLKNGKRSGSIVVPLQAARRLIGERRPHLREQYLKGQLTFAGRQLEGAGGSQDRKSHEGASAGLAVAALMYSAALKEAGERERFVHRRGAAFTGRMREDGRVGPVDEESLPLKVRTAFFSPMRALAVPKGQEGEAEAAVAALKEEYPHGRLDVIGTRRLRDVFDHRRLTERVETPWLTHAARWAWSRKGTIAASTVVVALTLALAWLAYGPIDKNPVQARYTGEMMIVENDLGQELRRFDVGKVTVNRYKDGYGQSGAALADVTGDGRNEIFWAAAVDSAKRRSALRAKAVGADTLLWEKRLQFEVPFPRKPGVVGRSYVVNDLLAGDHDRDGEPDLYAALNHSPYFPGLLLELDAATGTVEQRYVHPGHFSGGLHPVDLDGDAPEELVAGGYSNAFDDPVLVVLDPRRLQGHAPTRGAYAVAGAGLARHHAYLRLPSTKVQEAAPTTSLKVQQIEVGQSPVRITAEYEDGRPREDFDRKPYVLMHLSRDLRPIGVGTSSKHDRLAERLVEAGRLGAPVGPKDLKRLQEEILYWTEEGWKR
jgi:hypothetical protein